MKKCILFPLLLISILALAQNQKNIPVLKGVIMDAKTSELLPFVNVVIIQNGEQITGTQSDFDGNFSFKDIPTGTYSLQLSFMGYKTARLNEITIWEGQTRDLKITMTQSSIERICCIMYCYQPNEPMETPIDLIAEQDSINKAEDKQLPSSIFENEGTSAEFMVHPNPTIGKVTIDNIKEINELRLYDITGHLLQIIPVQGQQTQLKMNLESYKTGLYLLNYVKNETLYTVKIIKQ